MDKDFFIDYDSLCRCPAKNFQERMYADFFKIEFSKGGRYQELLEKLCRAWQYKMALWLINIFGPTDDVMELKNAPSRKRPVVFTGSVHIEDKIHTALIAGGDITGDDILSCSIVAAGGDIASKGIITAGSLRAG